MKRMRVGDATAKLQRQQDLDAALATLACPQCGSPLNVDEQAIKFTRDDERGEKPITVRAAFCCGCEWIQEF